MSSITLAFPASSQEGIRPSDRPPVLPPLEEPRESPPLELPPIGEEKEGIPPGALRLRVERVAVYGSTVFSEEELEAITRPYWHRMLTSRDLTAMTQELTRLYTSRGYVTSRAFLPDQDAEGGVVRIEIVEGRVSSMVIEGNHTLRESFLRSRIERASRTPLNAERLAEELEVLQRNRQIERISGVLGPGDGPGANSLRVTVVERLPWALALIADNHHSPSIGSTGGGIEVARWSLTGFGEEIWGRAWFTEGLREGQARVSVPISVWDTALAGGFWYSVADVVESPFDDLDIKGRFRSAFLELRQPLFRSSAVDLDAAVRGEWRQSRSRLLSRTVCFQPAATDCKPTVSVIRAEQNLSWRAQRFAIAARSTFSFGIDALGSTVEKGKAADSRFFAWLGQLQGATLLPVPGSAPGWLLRTQFVGRVDLQVAADPLLSMEQIAIGGSRTVRGYRENLVVRDNGVVGSVELRVPVLHDRFDRSLVELAGFYDAGRVWDVRGDIPSETITSIGVGIRIFPLPRLRGELYWGHRFQNQIVEGDTLQREGLYFQVVWNVL